MTTFLLLATLLVVAVVALVLPPLLRGPGRRAATEQSAANLAILRDELAELEHERAEGSLADADYAQAKAELQRRALDEARPVEATAGGRPARKTAAVLALAIPAAALAGYVLLGDPRGLESAPAGQRPPVTQEQIAAMVERLAAKVKANPDDKQGWLMLARSYKVLGRFPDAVDAYEHAGDAVDGNARLLADYAEAILLVNDGRVDAKADGLLKKALAADPNEPQALLLSGLAAREHGRHAEAAELWSRLLVLMPSDADEAKQLKAAVAEEQKAAKLPPR